MPEQAGLAAALAKAQAAFPTINRDKEVRVTSERTGKSYTFKYAPLDTILTAVRKPLADNGLAIVQLLDEDYLVTSLLHESGGILSGRTPIPPAEGIQAYGSAITYLRRYAIQALLGIAAEEDDDGNQAEGNAATFGVAPKVTPSEDGSLIGTVEVGKASAKTDLELRETPDGHVIGFRLVSGKGGIKVLAFDPLASALALVKESIIDQRVQCWGTLREETFRPKGSTKDVKYLVMILEKIQTSELTLPSEEEIPDTIPAFDESELDAVMEKVP